MHLEGGSLRLQAPRQAEECAGHLHHPGDITRPLFPQGSEG